MSTRRSFIRGLLGLTAAAAVPVRAAPEPELPPLLKVEHTPIATSGFAQAASPLAYRIVTSDHTGMTMDIQLQQANGVWAQID